MSMETSRDINQFERLKYGSLTRVLDIPIIAARRSEERSGTIQLVTGWRFRQSSGQELGKNVVIFVHDFEGFPHEFYTLLDSCRDYVFRIDMFVTKSQSRAFPYAISASAGSAKPVINERFLKKRAAEQHRIDSYQNDPKQLVRSGADAEHVDSAVR
jgi:hypothetical protein